MSEYLLDQLKEYAGSDAYPLHMPGHKRQIRSFEDPFSIDITEIDGFDNLHHAQGILLEAERRAARLYGADETYYLINGSTCGILAAVSASVRRGGRILMARNSHKAAYHAALLNDLRVGWLYPEMDMGRGMYGSVSPKQVRAALEGNGKTAAAVLITSPTYEGVVSDIRAIADETHRAGAVLIVDEAHGAHFAMHPYFPESALSCGADIVVNSLHKTMPSLTQTALLHVKGGRVDRGRLRKYLDIYQSSSPSYVLMAGMDECVRLMEASGRILFDGFVQRLKGLRERLGEMKLLHLMTGEEPALAAFAFDKSRIVISTEKSQTGMGGTRLTGSMLARTLREYYHLEAEMAAENYVTAIMTVADTQDGFERLESALLEIDAGLWKRAFPAMAEQKAPAAQRRDLAVPYPEEAMTMTEADGSVRERVLLEDSPGRVSAEFIYLYPPGIPVLVPGERVPDELPELLAGYRRQGLQVQGMEDDTVSTLQCVAESARDMRSGKTCRTAGAGIAK